MTISCQPNSNFSALYSGIGKATDFALNTDIYQKQIDRIKTLAGKMNKVIELIELFAIGTIILDEIQLIDFKTTKESSFEALMVITNETKMAFCAVGTTEAYVKCSKSSGLRAGSVEKSMLRVIAGMKNFFPRHEPAFLLPVVR